jgi:hypothetical protein
MAYKKELKTLRYMQHQNFLEMQIKETRLKKKYVAKFEKEFEKQLGFENDIRVLEDTFNAHSSCILFYFFNERHLSQCGAVG